jgi:prepilin-type N-terminal cleavage/methylation domain-containing protein
MMSGCHHERGFSLLELMITLIIGIIIAAMAIAQVMPAVANAKADAAMRQVVDQLRQAREYSVTNRRYVQVTFPVVVAAGVTQYQIQMTERNDLTAGAGPVNPVLSTVPIQAPLTFYVNPAMPDTPDAYGNANKIFFGGVAGGPIAGMLFQSDGELVAGATYQPINGTVFLGVAGEPAQTRAVTVLGSTGRVRGWRAPSGTWIQF